MDLEVVDPFVRSLMKKQENCSEVMWGDACTPTVRGLHKLCAAGELLGILALDWSSPHFSWVLPTQPSSSCVFPFAATSPPYIFLNMS